MTNRSPVDKKGLPEWADRVREWLDEVLPVTPPEPVMVPVPVRRPPSAAPARRRRRR